MINVTLNRAILLEIYLHCPDNVPVPIFVHLLHGYSQNCYLVGIEFPLNLNLEFLVQAGEWDIGLFQQIFPKIQLCQVVKHIGRGRPEHWATYIEQMADLKEFRSKAAKFANLGNSVGGRSDVVFSPIPGIYATRRLWVCSAAIIGLVSTRSYSSVLPLQDCLVICHLRFDPDMSCELS